MINTSDGYTVGDYVIVSHPDPDTDHTFGQYTFKIVGFTPNLFGRTLARVVDIARPDAHPTTFYPHELSWEDGSRPVLGSLGYAADYPSGTHVSRGAW